MTERTIDEALSKFKLVKGTAGDGEHTERRNRDDHL